MESMDTMAEPPEDDDERLMVMVYHDLEGIRTRLEFVELPFAALRRS
jgi:hypothetical protein